MKNILKAISDAHGIPFFVGGFVRDKVMGFESKDIDVEVFHLSFDELNAILSKFGKTDVVGKSFGVIKLRYKGEDYDFSLPRRDSKISDGHKGFEVKVDHNMCFSDAAKRRDFTINAIMEDQHGNVVDPFGGVEDIKRGVLSATSTHFSEDPLRVLRGFQFAGRFNMVADSFTQRMCIEVLKEAGDLSKERVREEFAKWALKSIKPSAGLNFLRDVNWLSVFPAIGDLQGCMQDPEWHPEGDAFIHTGLVCDAMADICVREGIEGEDRLVLMLAALCHDIGKPATTAIVNGRWSSKGHAEVGAEMTSEFLLDIGFGPAIIDRVVPLVREHMAHVSLSDPTKSAVRRLARRIHPSNIEHLVLLIEADYSGRPPKRKECPPVAVYIRFLAKEVGVFEEKPKPIIQGRHLIDIGMKPGPNFAPILERMFQMQIDGVFETVDEGIEILPSVAVAS